MGGLHTYIPKDEWPTDTLFFFFFFPPERKKIWSRLWAWAIYLISEFRTGPDENAKRKKKNHGLKRWDQPRTEYWLDRRFSVEYILEDLLDFFFLFLFFYSFFSFLALKIRATNCFDWDYLSTRDFCFCVFFLELVHVLVHCTYGCSYPCLMTARRLAIAFFSIWFFSDAIFFFFFFFFFGWERHDLSYGLWWRFCYVASWIFGAIFPDRNFLFVCTIRPARLTPLGNLDSTASIRRQCFYWFYLGGYWRLNTNLWPTGSDIDISISMPLICRLFFWPQPHLWPPLDRDIFLPGFGRLERPYWCLYLW